MRLCKQLVPRDFPQARENSLETRLVIQHLYRLYCLTLSLKQEKLVTVHLTSRKKRYNAFIR